MKLISCVSSGSDNTFGCEYASVELTPALARLALSRMRMFKELKITDPQLDEMHFWDYHAEYFSPWNAESDDQADSMVERLGALPAVATDLMEAPTGFSVPESFLRRVECCQMIVAENSIAFVAVPKHASHYVRTAEISSQVVEAAAAT